MKAVSIIFGSVGALRKNPVGFVFYLLLYAVSAVVAFGAAVGATFLVALSGIVQPAIAGEITFIAATALLLLAIWLLFLLVTAGLKGAFFRALYEAGRGGGMGFIQFLEYTAHKAVPMFGLELALLALLAIFLAPAALALVFVNSQLVSVGLALLGLGAFCVVSLFFALAIPAVVLDNESSIGAIMKSARTVISSPAEFIGLAAALGVIWGIGSLFIIPLLILPQILAYSLMLYYGQAKRA